MKDMINSKEYWDKRFESGDWSNNNGENQTKFFYNILLNLLSTNIIENITIQKMSIADVGCALGDGTAVLAKKFNTSKIVGFDFSIKALEKARNQYPQIEFLSGNVTDFHHDFDVIILSNILEHFSNPFEIAANISQYTSKYLVILIPFEERNLTHEHISNFEYENIPLKLGECNLVFYNICDCRKMDNSVFFAKQILLVYSKDRDIIRKSSLKNLHIAMEIENRNLKLQNKKLVLQNQKVQKDRENLLFAKEKNEAKFNSLYYQYSETVNRLNTFESSRTWRYANKGKNIAQKFGLIKVAKGANYYRKNGLNKTIKKIISEKNKYNYTQKTIENEKLFSRLAINSNTELVQKILYREKLYAEVLDGIHLQDEVNELMLRLQGKHYKGIIVYPHAVHWNPIQRPQHILREFSKKGYLCFFCENDKYDKNIEEVYNNLFIVNNEAILLPFLQDKNPIVLITYFLQCVFEEFLPQKFIWFDLLDRPDFFDNFNNGEIDNDIVRIYDQVVKEANVVSYTAHELKKYVKKRTDALFLPNAVNIKDFDKKDDDIVDQRFQIIVDRGKPVIGYFGAIEQWFDYKQVVYLANNFDCEIVLIGQVGIDPELLKGPNIHLFGPMNHQKLAYYAKKFTIGMIPFCVNSLTNSVSPVKFYEYCACGIPILSSEIKEMLRYGENENVYFYNQEHDIVSSCKNILKIINNKTKEISLKFAMDNTWEHRCDMFLSEALKNIKNLRLFSALNDFKNVSIITVTFFDYEGNNYYSGGAERYLIDLHEVCKSMGVQLRVYQYASYNWVRLFNDMVVVGLAPKKCDVSIFNADLVKKMSNEFHSFAGEKSCVNIYSPFYIIDKSARGINIGISHGISWDNENNCRDALEFCNRNKNIVDSAETCDQMISVDTNTCNWFQTIDYELGRKISYIPNYVDTTKFIPRKNYDKCGKRIVITYPRRLYKPRGFYVVLHIIDHILKKYDNVDFQFVGKGFDEDTKFVLEKIKKWGNRIKWYSCLPNQMIAVYQESDISLIPTMFSEGTSLSCLEALSCGNAVIATRVGGLTDIIINNYNGILIEPNAKALSEAIEKLIEHPEIMNDIKHRAVESAKVFSEVSWKIKWKNILRMYTSNSEQYSKPFVCIVKLNNDDLYNSAVICKIKQLLEKKYFVYITTKNNEFKLYSFQRLQFIFDDEEMYTVPDLRFDDATALINYVV